MSDKSATETALPEPDENGWRSIECAPKDDCLVLTDGGCLYQGFWQTGKGWITGVSSGALTVYLLLEPTHWQPLLKGPVING